jgi:sporulation protein YlmC with PRC-barrel domain
MNEITEAYDWQGRTIVGSDGEKIGKVDEVYLDDRSGKPEWATVKSGIFGSKSNFVPLAGASSVG